VAGGRWQVTCDRWQVAGGSASATDLWCSSAILFEDQLASQQCRAGGRWRVASSTYHVTGGGGRWPVAGGSAVAADLWCNPVLGPNRESAIQSRWQVAGGRWQVAGGR
jgi:hypothetical protein